MRELWESRLINFGLSSRLRVYTVQCTLYSVECTLYTVLLRGRCKVCWGQTGRCRVWWLMGPDWEGPGNNKMARQHW